jgi:hypothetical protein
VATLPARAAAEQTQRQIAAELGVARSTLQQWRDAPAPANSAVPAALLGVLQTPAGVRWLHQVVVAAQFVITLRAGVRMVCEFLQLSGLSRVAGAAYGSQQALNTACVFRRKWPPSPKETGQRFRSNPAGDSDESGHPLG